MCIAVARASRTADEPGALECGAGLMAQAAP